MIQKKILHETPYILLALLIIFFILTHSPNSVDYDASSYINFDPIRPPLYPIFTWLCHFAGTYQFKLIVWTHAIFTFSALLYTRYWLRKYLRIADFIIFLMCLFVTFTILFHFQLLLIGAEGLTFPFFIFTFFLLIECAKEYSLKKLSYLALLTSLLVLTRLQFYYFYVIFVLLCIWYIWRRTPIKPLSIGIAILLGSILLTCFIDRSYHYFKHGFFSAAPAAGALLIVQPIFLAGDTVVDNYFKNEKEKTYAKRILTLINKNKLNKTANLLTIMKPSYYEYAYEEYNKNYIIIHDLVSQVLAAGKPFEINTMAKDITKVLVFHNPKRNFLFFLWKFVLFVGGVPFFLFFLILFSVLMIKIVSDRNWKPNFVPIFVAMVVIITFFNAAIVAAVETYQSAYFCYPQFMLYCLAAFFSDNIFLKSENL